MAGNDAFPSVSMSIMRGCLVVSIQVELYDAVMLRLQQDVLEKIRETGVRGVILDVSAVEIMDTFVARTFSDIAAMAALLGVQTVMVGLHPGVAGALTCLGVALSGTRAAVTP